MSERGPSLKGNAKREEILEIALEVYAEFGYDRTSIREVARRSGLTQAGLLHHFSSKEELFIEILRRRDARAVSPSATGAGAAHSVAVLIAAVARNEEEADLVRLFVNMSAESTDVHAPSRAFFADRYRWLTADIASDIEAMQERGEFTSLCDATEVAAVLIAVADGLQLQWLLDRDIGMAELLTKLWTLLRQLPVLDADHSSLAQLPREGS